MSLFSFYANFTFPFMIVMFIINGGIEMKNAIFIDLRNKEHVKWWNETASKLVDVIGYEDIAETKTGVIVGKIFLLKGLKRARVIKENSKFLSNPVKVKWTLKLHKQS